MYILWCSVDVIVHCIIMRIFQVGKVGADADEWVEPEMHPLWEYPTYPRSEVHTLMTFNLASPIPSSPIMVGGTMELTRRSPLSNGSSRYCEGGQGGQGAVGSGRCNAVVLWMDYQLSEQHTSTTGLIKVTCTM